MSTKFENTDGGKAKAGESIDFLETGFKFNKNCAASTKIVENFKISSDQLRSEIKADEKGIEDYESEMLRLKQRREFLKKRIVENKAWAANFDTEFGPFINKYNEFMEQMSHLYKNAKDKHENGLKLLREHFSYHPEFKRWSDTFSAVPFKPK